MVKSCALFEVRTDSFNIYSSFNLKGISDLKSTQKEQTIIFNVLLDDDVISEDSTAAGWGSPRNVGNAGSLLPVASECRNMRRPSCGVAITVQI